MLLLEDAVLAEGEERLEDVLTDVEADDQLLPREEGAVEEPCKALQLSVWSASFAARQSQVD